MFSSMLEECRRLASREMLSRPAAGSHWLPLSGEQVRRLEEQGCSSSDWSKVMVGPRAALESVRNCRFLGRVRLSLAPAVLGGKTIEPLLWNSILEDVDLGPGCRIISAGTLRNLVLEEGGTVENCGSISFSEGSPCGCGQELELGVETGERNVPSFPCLDVQLAFELSGGEGRPARMSLYRSMLDMFLQEFRSAGPGRLCRESSVTGTPVVEDSFIGPGASISNATAVRNSTLLAGACIMDGALVRDSILKWDARADSMAVVERSVVDEASIVEKHGKLTSSFLGPNSVLGSGEITASLAGPFTACHHQSLLIAARWPEGRGNIGYGANVGSNHTSRLPDQEIRPGEGMFFGLACSVKFPADYSLAPYSIIATGVTTLPQRVEFPFSLICGPFVQAEGVPPAYNQILPAWVLSHNMFAVRRNDLKFSERNRATHWQQGNRPVLRRETVELMERAVHLLEVEETRDVYLDRHIPGLGKNFMTEEHRQKALESYGFHIGLFALEALGAQGKLEVKDPFVSGILEARFGGMVHADLLELREGMLRRLEEDVAESRRRDHVRGSGMIADYLSVRDITL